MRNKHFDFLAHFIDLTDPRADRGWNHQLTDLVALALCAMLCGADNWADVERFSVSNQEWFEQYLDLPEGIPSHDTFSRVFAILDCAEFESAGLKTSEIRRKMSYSMAGSQMGWGFVSRG